MSDNEMAEILRPLVKDLVAHGVNPAKVRVIAIGVMRQALAKVRSERDGQLRRASGQNRPK